MVDAVTAVNAATRIQIEQRKDLTVDWNKLSASEILEHAQKGDEVPIDILHWAEDYSKLANAPDDVTYESVNGSTNTQEVLEETGEEDSPEEEEATTNLNMTVAQQDRQVLVEQGVSLYDQGKSFADKSKISAAEVNQMQENTQNLLKQGEETENSANQITENTVNSTKSIKKEYDDHLKKVQDDIENVSPGDLNKLAKYGKQLQQYGMRAQSQMLNFDIQLQAIEDEFSQYAPIPELSNDYGDVTVDIGKELITHNPETQDVATPKLNPTKFDFSLKDMKINRFRFMFDRDYKMGVIDVKNGTEAIDSGDEGKALLEEATNKNSGFKTTISNNKSEIEDATYIKGMNEPSQEDNEQQRTERSKERQKDNTDADGTKDLSKILTDPLEIQKRKERLGLT